MQLFDLGGSRVILAIVCPVIIWEVAWTERDGDNAQPEFNMYGLEAMVWHTVDTRWQCTETTGSVFQAIKILGAKLANAEATYQIAMSTSPAHIDWMEFVCLLWYSIWLWGEHIIWACDAMTLYVSWLRDPASRDGIKFFYFLQIWGNSSTSAHLWIWFSNYWLWMLFAYQM